MENIKEFFGDVIHTYTRKQAIDDGVLVDVTETASEAGIRFPVAVTSAVWHEYVVPNEELKTLGQSTEGRLWDVLWMFRCSAVKNSKDVMLYELYFTMIINGKPKQKLIKLKAICGPGDQAEPVITIMKPEED